MCVRAPALGLQFLRCAFWFVRSPVQFVGRGLEFQRTASSFQRTASRPSGPPVSCTAPASPSNERRTVNEAGGFVESKQPSSPFLYTLSKKQAFRARGNFCRAARQPSRRLTTHRA